MMLSAEEKSARMSAERAVLTKLLQAAVSGDFATVKRVTQDYLHQNTDLTVTEVLTQFKDAQKRTVMHFACQSKARPTGIDTCMNKPIHTDTGTGTSTGDDGQDIDIVEELLKWLPPEAVAKVIRSKDSEGMTPIMLAAQCFDTATAERRILALLKADADTTTTTGDGTSSTSNLGLGRSKAGATALHYAAANGATAATVTALIAAGKVALHTFSLQGGTPLHWACSVPPPTDHTETMTALIAQGANVNAASDSIPPPLALAMAAGNDKHAKCILQAGTDLEPSIDFVLQPGNVTMYHMAADMNLPGSLALLIEHCKDPSSALQQRNGEGYTVLDLAAKEGHTGCVLLLLSATGEGSTEEDAVEYMASWKTNRPETVETESGEPVQPPKPPDDAEEDPVEAEAKQAAASIQEAAGGITDDQKKLAQEHKTVGNEHYNKKEWTEAIAEYSLAIATDASDAATYYSNRSACYMAMDQPEQALHDAMVARCLKPDWPKAAYRMAVARLALGRYEDAAVSAWEGLQQDSENDDLKNLLQKCVKKGRTDFHGSISKKGSSR